MQVDVALINILLAREMKKKCNTICRQVESTSRNATQQRTRRRIAVVSFFRRADGGGTFFQVGAPKRARSILCTYVHTLRSRGRVISMSRVVGVADGAVDRRAARNGESTTRSGAARHGAARRGAARRSH